MYQFVYCGCVGFICIILSVFFIMSILISHCWRPLLWIMLNERNYEDWCLFIWNTKYRTFIFLLLLLPQIMIKHRWIAWCFRKFSEVFRNFPEFSDIFRNFLVISEVFRNFPIFSEIFWYFPKLSQNVGNFSKLPEFFEISLYFPSKNVVFSKKKHKSISQSIRMMFGVTLNNNLIK